MNVLVVAAHPDDEVLGCGATMALHAARGDTVHTMVLAEGIISRGETSVAAKRKLAALHEAAGRANRRLGVKKLELLQFPDNRMDSVDRLEVIQAVEAKIAAFRPVVVYTHHPGDLNIDHQITHEAVAAACRPLPGQTVKKVLCFEVPSSSEWRFAGSGPAFAPNWFIDVGAHLQAKIAALREYKGEMRPWPHPRSYKAVTHLAHWRGASVGCEAAEAFVLARMVEA
jgi:LmbE family N-acetylglucosaminyl deacetylase